MLYKNSVVGASRWAGQSARRSRAGWGAGWRTGLLLGPVLFLVLAGTGSNTAAAPASRSSCGQFSPQRRTAKIRSGERRGRSFPARLVLLGGLTWFAASTVLREQVAPPPPPAAPGTAGLPVLVAPQRAPEQSGAVPESTAIVPPGTLPGDPQQLPQIQPAPGRTATPMPSPPVVAVRPLEHQFGHLPYGEAPAADLVSISADGRIKLRSAAAKRWNEMVAAAASSEERVRLVPLSGFRSRSEQEYLFHDIARQRGQSLQERAKVSAPPGHSEHHTGYVVDIGDGREPGADLKQSFERTGAFKWLEKNGPRYGYELSFPAGNPQGVSYEPWHWRFVGDAKSKEVFARAFQLKSGAKLAGRDRF
jgi:D-alanyl-D-alanine carboxypeptidase